MSRAALIVIALAACGGKKTAPTPRPELIETMRDMADRVCACETDKDCVREIRTEWDAQKADLMNHGLVGEQRAEFETELHRVRSCGDGGGLTFWMPPAPQD
jgi:hypothetical protein